MKTFKRPTESLMKYCSSQFFFLNYKKVWLLGRRLLRNERCLNTCTAVATNLSIHHRSLSLSDSTGGCRFKINFYMHNTGKAHVLLMVAINT